MSLYSIFDNYPTKISKLQEKIDELKIKQESFKQELLKLEIGDTVHINDSGDFFPQKIQHIDLEKLELLVLEESINKTSTITMFYVQEESGNMRYIS